MPVKPNDEEILSNNCEQATQTSMTASEGEEGTPVRELTQTDRLNKKLLTAFLERMNTSSFVGPSTENPEVAIDDDFS